jgi:hypothetical protein
MMCFSPHEDSFWCTVVTLVRVGQLLCSRCLNMVIFRGAGICTPDDPLWKTVAYFLPKQVELFKSFTLKENDGLYNVSSDLNFACFILVCSLFLICNFQVLKCLISDL